MMPLLRRAQSVRRRLFADESVFYDQDVVGELLA